MKTTKLILAAALGLAITGTLVAQNQNPNAPQHPRLAAMLRARMLHKADTDGDGRLNDAERAAAKAKFQEHRKEFIAKHDTDGDGKLNEAERAAATDQIIAAWGHCHAKLGLGAPGTGTSTIRPFIGFLPSNAPGSP